VVSRVERMTQSLQDNRELLAMAREENDESGCESVAADVRAWKRIVAEMEFRRMFSNPMDPNNCFLDVQAGTRRYEAQDWASMLERMYFRFCERRGFKVEVLEESAGEVAGIKSASLKVSGDYAYGTLRTGSGIHRLVRKSPFDSNARRHTSFASVFVYPEVDETIEIEINPADLRIDTFRASGAGGQHVNKTDSAIRITHLPTNIVVQCQNDRSQHRNRAEAMAMLKRSCTKWSCASARPRSRRWKNPRPTSAGAIKSARMFWISRASRICAPTSRWATRRAYWTAIWMNSSRRA
jgi:peptide chain release factor 2